MTSVATVSALLRMRAPEVGRYGDRAFLITRKARKHKLSCLWIQQRNMCPSLSPCTFLDSLLCQSVSLFRGQILVLICYKHILGDIFRKVANRGSLKRRTCTPAGCGLGCDRILCMRHDSNNQQCLGIRLVTLIKYSTCHAS